MFPGLFIFPLCCQDPGGPVISDQNKNAIHGHQRHRSYIIITVFHAIQCRIYCLNAFRSPTRAFCYFVVCYHCQTQTSYTGRPGALYDYLHFMTALLQIVTRLSKNVEKKIIPGSLERGHRGIVADPGIVAIVARVDSRQP